jgi:hypothetical protein
MYLPVQIFDGHEGWLRAITSQTISIQPLTEAALVHIPMASASHVRS